jgi:hypothetical protein
MVTDQEIAKVIREATRVTPSQEMLRRMESQIQTLVTPNVSAQLDANTGRVTVRIGRPRHDARGLAFVIRPVEVAILVEDEAQS